MKQYTIKPQQGMALLASIIIVILFTILGFTVAQKGKINQEFAGSTVRHGIVFEAAEQTLRDAMFFINDIRTGPPIATDDGTAGRARATNFNPKKIGPDLSINPSTSFVWRPGALANKVCGKNKCQAGINFAERIDEDIWQNLAIPSILGSSDGKDAKAKVDKKSYINNIKTYTFIEYLGNGGRNSTQGSTTAVKGGKGGSGNARKYYMITVKASGYPPGAKITADNARENVILQTIYAQVY